MALLVVGNLWALDSGEMLYCLYARGVTAPNTKPRYFYVAHSGRLFKGYGSEEDAIGMTNLRLRKTG